MNKNKRYNIIYMNNHSYEEGGATMEIKQISAIILLAIFYSIYLTKLLAQKSKGIQTQQIGKGNKNNKTLLIERIMGNCSWVIIVIEVISIIINKPFNVLAFSYIGIVLMIIGDIVFLAAVLTMRDSWRAGIAKEDETKLVTDGIYKISRNPAFLGFYLVYIGVMLAFINLPLIIMTLITILAFHMQIKEEEIFLEERFGKQYVEYKQRVGRYFIFF